MINVGQSKIASHHASLSKAEFFYRYKLDFPCCFCKRSQIYFFHIYEIATPECTKNNPKVGVPVFTWAFCLYFSNKQEKNFVLAVLFANINQLLMNVLDLFWPFLLENKRMEIDISLVWVILKQLFTYVSLDSGNLCLALHFSIYPLISTFGKEVLNIHFKATGS